MQLFWVKENELTGEKIEFVVNYFFDGAYYPNTSELPSEYPDLTFTVKGLEQDKITEPEYQSIENACANRDGFLLTFY